MYTQCLDCLTIYKIVAESLQLSHGQFRCGHCGAVFNALPSLTEKLPEGAVVELPRSEEVLVPAVLSIPAMRPVRPAPLRPDDRDDVLISQFDISEAINASAGRIEPVFSDLMPTPSNAGAPPGRATPDWVSFRPGEAAPVAKKAEAFDLGREARFSNNESANSARPKPLVGRAHYDLGAAPPTKIPPKPMVLPGATPGLSFRAEVRSQYVPEAITPQRSWPWVLVACILSLALIAQLGFYQRRALLAHDDSRKLLELCCSLLQCRLPLREDLARLKVLDSDVKPHPRTAGALLITASLRNDGTHAQNYPIVEVKLLDKASRPVALRRFAPRSYLGDANAIAAGIAANANLPIIFEVIDPGANASGFEFSFLPGPNLADDLTRDLANVAVP
jgi:predicted Zn finger-like uncharacterized protein